MAKFKFNMEYYAKLYWDTRKYGSLSDGSLLKEHLKKVGDYLDGCGMEISTPKYPYQATDKTTWKYIETKDCDEQYLKDLDYKGWYILNPDWKYAEQEKQDILNALNH